jgi:hypothetical protein
VIAANLCVSALYLKVVVAETDDKPIETHAIPLTFASNRAHQLGRVPAAERGGSGLP